MDYASALRDLEARVPSRMVPDLERITALADLLGDPQRTYPSVHVTGTNGKTSVTSMVSSLLAGIGLSPGTYTSPHLQTVRERIRAASEPISEEDFAEAYAGLLPLAEVVEHDRRATAERITYFEMLTALAYWWFADRPVDVGVFEVGMGGTWDATNLVRGEVAVLTAIGVDHPELGSTPAETADEKVGIIKPRATVVSSPQDDAVLARIATATEAAAGRLLLVGRDLEVEERRLAVGGQVLTLRTPSARIPDLFVPLHGAHQADNAAAAIGALEGFLGGLGGVDAAAAREAFAAVEVPGRLEVVTTAPTVILDAAHNPHGAQRAAAGVAEAFDFRDLILVAGCLDGKDVRGILEAFRGLAGHVVVTAAPSPRALSVDTMAAVAREVWSGTRVAIEMADGVADALAKATGVAGERDGVLVTGSITTVGAARDLFRPLGAPTH
ncbi:MAG TPA: Mur ligase family protein [Solirubrobacteraceae bacterium]|nr:Mur ligase family protein [Solirubrobacteraceae bacterium]